MNTRGQWTQGINKRGTQGINTRGQWTQGINKHKRKMNPRDKYTQEDNEPKG